MDAVFSVFVDVRQMSFTSGSDPRGGATFENMGVRRYSAFVRRRETLLLDRQPLIGRELLSRAPC
jgi:hypothetical protein